MQIVTFLRRVAATVALATALSPQAQITPGEQFMLQLKDSDLYLSASPTGDSSEATQQTLGTEGWTQVFTIEEAPSGAQATGYNLKTADGNYIVRDSWKVLVKPATTTLTSKDAIFTIESDGDYVKFKNAGTGKYIGKDNQGAGQKVYSDKSGNSTCLFSVVGMTADFYRTALQSAIDDAQALLASTTAGTEPGQYSADRRAELEQSVTDATAALTGDIDTIKAAQTALAAAVAAYKASKIPAVFQEGYYRFQSVALPGAYLANGWHANSWESWNVESTALLLNLDEAGEYNLKFYVKRTVSESAATGYTIQDNAGHYLYNAGGKLLYSEDDATVDHLSADAVFIFEDAGDSFRIKSVATGKYVGPNDDTKGWSWIHIGTKHSGKENGNLFAPEFLGESTLNMLDKQIAAAEALLADTQEGTEPGQYSAAARTALAEAIAAAKEARTGSEDEMIAAVAMITEAIAAYNDAKVPPVFQTGIYRFAFVPIEGTYLSNGWHANSWESWNVLSCGLILDENEPAYNQEFVVSRTPDDAEAQGYTIRDKDGHYLYNDNGALLYSEEDTIDPLSLHCIYVFEFDGDNVRIKSAATGKYVGPIDDTAGWTWIHLGTKHSGKANGNLFRPELLGENVADQLQNKINEAEALLAGTEEGDQPGQYSAEARQALQDAINEAKSHLQGTNDEILTAAAALNNAILAYNDMKVPAFFQSGTYKFHHVALDGAVLANGFHANSWESGNVEQTALIINENEAGEYNTMFTVLPVSGNASAKGYNILDNERNLLYNDGGKLLYGTADADELKTIFVFEPDGDNVRIRSVESGKNVGPVDDTKGWSWIHAGTTHTGKENGDLFRAELIPTAIGEIESAAACAIRGGEGHITVAGADRAVIYTVDGKVIATAQGDAISIAMPAGLYIVNATTGNTVRNAKVIVR